MLFSEEKLDEYLIDEIEELFPMQHPEVDSKEVMYDMDWDAYLKMGNLLRVYTVRENKRLVGYSAYIVTMSLHYKGEYWAINDAIYILPEYRKGGKGEEFITFCEVRLAQENAVAATMSVKPGRNFSEMLMKIGYELEETMYLKRI